MEYHHIFHPTTLVNISNGSNTSSFQFQFLLPLQHAIVIQDTPCLRHMSAKMQYIITQKQSEADIEISLEDKIMGIRLQVPFILK